MKNLVLLECAEHLAQDYHEQSQRVAARLGHPVQLPWNQLSPSTRKLAIQIMYAMRYRGVIRCPVQEHHVKVSLRGDPPR